jgi:hypothetical protein
MVGFNKSTSIEGECSQCLAPPLGARHCPRCGRQVGDIVWVRLQSEEIVFKDYDEPIRALSLRLKIRIFKVSADHVTGMWRIEKEVQRTFCLKLGETTEWEFKDPTPYRMNNIEIGSDEAQKAVNAFYRLRLLDFSPDYEEVTFLTEKIGCFKKKNRG